MIDTLILSDYLKELQTRWQTLVESLRHKGKSELDTEFIRGRIAELEQSISELKEKAAGNSR